MIEIFVRFVNGDSFMSAVDGVKHLVKCLKNNGCTKIQCTPNSIYECYVNDNIVCEYNFYYFIERLFEKGIVVRHILQGVDIMIDDDRDMNI